MPTDPASAIFAFVLEKAENEPLSKRIQLYGQLAQIINREDLAHELTRLAADLQTAERHHRALALRLAP